MKSHREPLPGVASALRHSLPYLRLFRGKIFVIKLGGAALGDSETTRALMEQIGLLHQVGIRPVVVHGGGPQSTELARALGAEARFVAGRRVTGERDLEVAAMTLNGTVNTELLRACRALGLPGVGVTGVDSGLVQATRRAPVTVRGDDGEETVDYGFVGDIERVDPALLLHLLDDGMLPIVSPLSADAEGNLLNINADTVAAALAVGLDAEKLILMTGAAGILTDPDQPGSLVPYTDLAGLEAMRRDGSLARGMLPKATAIEHALTGGVRRVHVISFELEDSLLTEVFTNEGCGTLIVPDTHAVTRAGLEGLQS
jgi:acetylglutamate kinase